MTRTEAAGLRLEEGATVWISPAAGAPTVLAATAPLVNDDDQLLTG